MPKLTVILILIFTFLSCQDRNEPVDISKLYDNDYRLFQQTNVWDLAKAVEDEDIGLIEEILKPDTLDINTQEPKFGQTLLFLTVANDDYRSFKKLIELGININIHNTQDSSSVIHSVCTYHGVYSDYTRYMELLIENGADVNDKLKCKEEFIDLGSTPLMMICSRSPLRVSNFKIANLLVENGANINFINPNYNFPLRACIAHSNYDIALYLIKEGAEYKIPLQKPNRFVDRDIYIMEKLSFRFERLGSKEHIDKMKLINYLESKGLKYKRITELDSPAMKRVKNMYPNTWEEYIKVY
jgi:ankyrin repeat protein